MEQIDFNFLNDSKIKDIVERDYKELQELAANNTTKSIIIVSGGILESLLIDALVFAKELDFEEACKGERKNGKKLNLFTFINLAKDKKIIREDVLSNAIRNYRNLVHAGKEIRENIHFDSADADLSLSAIKIVLRDLKKWYEKERFLQEIEKNVLNASDEEKNFLLLFASPTPTQPNQSEHPWLEFEVYGAKNNLVRRQILQELEKEKYNLLPEAISSVEKLLNQKIQRTTITIDLSNVAAPNVGGTGGTNRQIYR